MHDTNLEERLRSVLRQEGDGLPFTITTDELDRRLALRRRARNGQRLSVIAAGLAVVAVGAVFALGSGWLRGPSVAADPSPSATMSEPPSSPPPTTAPAASADPLAALPILVKDPQSLDVYMTEDPGDPSSDDPTLIGRGLDGVRMDAREAAIKVVCLGPDAVLMWGTFTDRTAIASETVVCDATVQSFRYDVAARQPMLKQLLELETTPRTAFRILIETFGSMNDPVRTVLPDFATPEGTVAVDFTGEPDPDLAEESVQTSAGVVPPRGQYLVALACVGDGTIRWDIGQDRLAGGGEQPCDGSALGYEMGEGVPPEGTAVLVTTSPRNHWHIVVTYDGDAPAFIAPVLMAYAGDDLEGPGSGALGLCVRWNEISDSCGVPFLARDGAKEVGVAVDSSLRLELADGWRIDNGGVEVMDRDVARRDPFGVSREFTSFRDGGQEVMIPLTGLEAGDWVIRVSLNGSKGDDTFGGVYSIPVIIGS